MATNSFLQIPSTVLLCLFVAATCLLPHPSHGSNISGSLERASCIIHMDELHFGPHYRPALTLDDHRFGSLDSRHPLRHNGMASVDHNGTAHGSRSPSNENPTKAACPQVFKIIAMLKNVHPKWSPMAIKSAIVTTATGIYHDDEGRALAVVNLHRAMNPGLVYDTSPKGHVGSLCSLNYTKYQNSNITEFELIRHDNCSKRSSLYCNYPSFVVLYDNKKTSPRVVVRRFRRTVRNVVEGGGVYKVDVVAPRGSSVTVHPKTLVFVKKYERMNYTLTVKYVKDKKGRVSRGWVRWNEMHGTHKVTSPIVIAPAAA
ncbi:unnamed protein product [Linum tenue]|uniref:Subtilisin-like protease fibronectin type-III domain-containing protein n=1 Tax=Linum tenue TaxID=586396 RepID=A0AAV0KUL1_9ROSI|nr:unnamed protein product [Linum tenue]